MPVERPKNLSPDQPERERALEASRSILVCAPAGSGKTDLLTRRFLRLLAEVDEPGQIVAITFTIAAAAEMRHRILSKLEEAAATGLSDRDDPLSMPALAMRALERSQAMGWNLLELPAQLRIQTIDSFCRELALQQPLLSGLGGNLEVAEEPTELYRRAARRTLERINGDDAMLRDAIERLLLWRDNSWSDVETQLVEMLDKRDQWMHGFVLDRDPDWEALRGELERPFARVVQRHLAALSRLLDQVPGAREEAMELARFGCENTEDDLYRGLAELADFPAMPFDSAEALEAAREAFTCLARMLLTKDGNFRQQISATQGFPKESKVEKARVKSLIASLDAIPGLEAAMAGALNLPPARYGDADWEIVKACFTLLRRAAGELRVAFAEAAAADYIEVAQIAEKVLSGEDGLPTEGAFAVSDNIRHLLVDEFQDTSRRQHQLLAHLIAAWPEREGRTCFVVGDPMQSIYSFRNADAELFPRVEELGLEIPGELPFPFDPVRLRANFRTAAPLVGEINDAFRQIFAADDGSGIEFEEAAPARDESASGSRLDFDSHRMNLHFEFEPQTRTGGSSGVNANKKRRKKALETQTQEIVELIRRHSEQIRRTQAKNQRKSEQDRRKYRVAMLGRTRRSLETVAAALREAAIPFRAIELESLKERPEILDALALARALFNPQDRVAWLGVLRAPWCGLSLADLHRLVSGDDAGLLARPVPALMVERLSLLSDEARPAVERVLNAVEFAERLRSCQPTAAPGTWLEQVWLQLGGAQCVDAEARANLDLLWRCLDHLPQGEPDVLGPALDAALGKLAALPDPKADSECGVQLMTIHKAKGLEFEVAIVPDLQAKSGKGKSGMLSWLERGLPAQPDAEVAGEPGEITEFLVAPLQSKGAERGKTKAWVDRVRREREEQEARRILYVACTRARDELHLFARPAYKTGKDNSLCLADPTEGLLKTAWPALQPEIQRQFEEWRMRNAAPEPAPEDIAAGEIDSIAAEAEGNLFEMPSRSNLEPGRPAVLRRLPANFRVAEAGLSSGAFETPLLGAGRLYERHEGGMLSRALGKAVHVALEELAQLLETEKTETARMKVEQLRPRIAADIRAAGVDAAQAEHLAGQAIEIALKAAADPIGQWILGPRAAAENEIRWTGVIEGSLRTVRVDRVFRAGEAPQTSETQPTAWWIIDYKTAHEEGLDARAAMLELRRIFAPQIQAYAQIIRNLHGSDAKVCCGLYYPRMTLLDWWPM